MTEHEEPYRHEVTPWTVGQLRRALEGLPDDLPLQVEVAEEPGGDTVDLQVVIGAGFGVGVGVGVGVEGNGEEFVGRAFGISCEFPSGEYHRRTR